MAPKSPAKASKKRKSTSSSYTGDRKRIVVQVADSKKEDNPIVVSFSSGVPEALRGGATPTATETPKFQWRKLSQKSKFGRVVSGFDKHCTYTGNAAGLAFDDRRTKLCVGVYDKKKGVVVLREAACKGTVFSLQQSVPNYLERHGTVRFEPGANLLSYSTQIFEDFGSHKKKKVLKSQAANQVDINHVVGAGAGSAVMEQVVGGKAMSESNRKAIAHGKANGTPTVLGKNRAVDAAHEVARRNFLPAYDENAVKPHNVYSVRDIAGDKAWTRLYNKVHACSHKDEVTEEIIGSMFETDWAPCALKLVKTISPDSRDAKDRYTCALLVNWLIKFYVSKQRRRTIEPIVATKSTYFGIPVEVAARCLESFTTAVPGDDGKQSYAMSKQNKDKLVVHALLVYIMAHGPSMKVPDIRPIAQDMKVPVNNCIQMLRLAGCSIAKKGVCVSVSLKTPLVFPPPPRRITRK